MLSHNDIAKNDGNNVRYVNPVFSMNYICLPFHQVSLLPGEIRQTSTGIRARISNYNIHVKISIFNLPLKVWISTYIQHKIIDVIIYPSHNVSQSISPPPPLLFFIDNLTINSTSWVDLGLYDTTVIWRSRTLQAYSSMTMQF